VNVVVTYKILAFALIAMSRAAFLGAETLAHISEIELEYSADGSVVEI
jgi:hypothetical protein